MWLYRKMAMHESRPDDTRSDRGAERHLTPGCGGWIFAVEVLARGDRPEQVAVASIGVARLQASRRHPHRDFRELRGHPGCKREADLNARSCEWIGSLQGDCRERGGAAIALANLVAKHSRQKGMSSSNRLGPGATLGADSGGLRSKCFEIRKLWKAAANCRASSP